MKIFNIIILVLILIFASYLYLRPEEEIIQNEELVEDVLDSNERRMESIPPQEGLPEIIEAKRQEIYKATLTRDFDALASVATTPFKYTFGENVEGGLAQYLKDAEKNNKVSVFDTIPILLTLPYKKDGNMYIWPAFFTKSAEEWTDEDVSLMQSFLTDEEIEGFRKFGAYIGYRIGINETGEWIYFIAGD